MAHTSTPTTPRLVALDEQARQRAARLVSTIASNYTVPRPAPGAAPAPRDVVDVAYVLTGAVKVGLNRWTLPASEEPPPELFRLHAGAEVLAVSVDVEIEDYHRAARLAERLGVEVDPILSCAACTGLAMLVSDAAIRGPFEVEV